MFNFTIYIIVGHNKVVLFSKNMDKGQAKLGFSGKMAASGRAVLFL